MPMTKRRFDMPQGLEGQTSSLKSSPGGMRPIYSGLSGITIPTFLRGPPHSLVGQLITLDCEPWAAWPRMRTPVSAGGKCNVLPCKVHSNSRDSFPLIFRNSRARTFMRSIAEEPKVDMLLFDEPSASLDPTAEHGAKPGQRSPIVELIFR